MAFKCVVVTPEQQMFDETITQAIVPAHDGKVGILTDRAPLLVKLAPANCGWTSPEANPADSPSGAGSRK